MFSKHEVLRKKSARNIGRKEFIEQLVTEYYATTNVENQEQITANLANFAYDPINYQYLRDAQALKLFFQLLSSSNERLVLHGVAGICNICMDPMSCQIITKPENIEKILKTFQNTKNIETTINILTILYVLSTDDENLKLKICSVENLKTITSLTKSSEERIKSMANVFIEDFVLKSNK